MQSANAGPGAPSAKTTTGKRQASDKARDAARRAGVNPPALWALDAAAWFRMFAFIVTSGILSLRTVGSLAKLDA
jgi:hypothetical protein